MSWLGSIGNLLEQYTGASANNVPADVHQHYDQAVQAAPPSTIADGIAAALRSGQTPPFAQMAGTLFGNSNGTAQAGLLNTLISSAGPALFSQVMGQMGGGGLLSQLGGGNRQITPEEASQVPPEVVNKLAEHAQNQDPSVIDRVSSIYAEHPTAVKALGGMALAIAMKQIAETQRR